MSVTPIIEYTKKLTAACACGRPATIAGQCNGCHEIGQYVKQIARPQFTPRLTVDLDAVRKLADNEEIQDAIARADERVKKAARERRPFWLDDQDGQS
jgi:hypothetical protein